MNKNIKITLIISITAIIITVLYTTINGYYKNKIQITMHDHEKHLLNRIRDMRLTCHNNAEKHAIEESIRKNLSDGETFLIEDYDRAFNYCLIRNNVD